ncbi:O-antigen ligase family protein [Sphingomonas faeni]|uniref:O-antigen ligase family protein n=1 Tax=Sphingomonas faeni TaxID=185950 RepID=UPI003349CC78
MRLRFEAPAFRFYILVAFLVVCAFTGGSSRTDAGLLLLLRPVTVLILASLVILSPRLELGSIRQPMILLGLFAATMLLQIIPLPPGLWLSLPGHERYAQAAVIAGIQQPWRPLSITPDLTLNSLVSLLPVLIMLIAFAGIGRRRNDLILFPLVLAGISVVLGIIQITGGPGSAAYLYRPTSDFLPVGLFANRNHQAVMLAVALPALAAWARHPRAGRYRLAIAGGFGLLLLPVILATGSRAGMALAGVGLVAAGILVWPVLKTWRIPRMVYLGAALLLVAAIGVTVFAGRAISIDRLADVDGPSTELRLVTLPIVLTIIRDHLPFGAGYGAFDQIFRSYEPDFLLRPTFFNRAHDDLLETVLSGGIPALIVMILFAVWWVRQTVQAWRNTQQASYDGVLARLGAIISGMLVLASIVDYPLRTPLAGVMFALACCWLSRAALEPER